MTDPISDMLTRLRNGVAAKHTRVDMPASKLKAEIARILQDEGYIQGFRLVDAPVGKSGKPGGQLIRVFLRFGVEDVPTVLGGLGTSILTTSRGVMTGRAAKKAGVGGEVLCTVW
jgi:small subunit ribosomal protein S8